jgi:hypothetical protein
MTDYKCGHSQDLLILDDNPLSMIAYLEWKDTVGRDGTKELCFGCYLKKSLDVNKSSETQP